MTTFRWRSVVGLFAVAALVASSCSSGGDEEGETAAGDPYRATIRRTANGVAHITADDFGSLGYGQGYAFAEDHACTLLDQVVKVRGERARWFGPGEDDANVNSDVAYKQLDLQGRAESGFEDLSADVQEVIEGYAAGVNAHIEQVGTDDLSGWCAGEPWVEALTATDLYAYYRDLALLASGRPLLGFMATAEAPGSVSVDPVEPPTTGSGGPGEADPDDPTATAGEDAWGTVNAPVASNGWAVGADRSESGGGLLLVNPHFPWEGELRLWESHLTIPGELDVYGASLLGSPGILVGFNDAVAWTHTVSAGKRFTAYTLDLVPGDPTSYLYDGEERAMEPTEVAVEVLGADGEVEERTVTRWSSHYGPILDFPGAEWTEERAVTYRDANIDNDELIGQFLAMDQSGSLEEFQAAHADNQGIPWVNTIAVSAEGTAWYADAAATPNLSAEALAGWLEARESDPLTTLAADNGAVLLDGSDSTNEWVDVDGARDPGLVPFEDVPQIERPDFVFNANDSYWLSNPGAPLTGFSPMHGEEDVAQSPRTRMNALTLSDETPAGPAGEDGLLSLTEVQDALFENESLTARLLREPVVERCRASGGSGVAEACDVLDAWDGGFDVDDAGAPLWREFLSEFDGTEFFESGMLFAEPFDAADPIATPSGLAVALPDGDPVDTALRAAVAVLDQVDLGPDATLGELQIAGPKLPTEIAVPGGGFREGVMNAVGGGGSSTSTEPQPESGPEIREDSGLTADGYLVRTGSSFVMVVDFTADGPRAEAILTYGQSGNAESTHFTDQTELFSTEQWRAVLFTEEDIEADPELTTIEVSSPR